MSLFGLNLFNMMMQEGGAPQGDIFGSLIPFIVIIVIFYFFLFAPMRKQKKQLQQTIATLKNGDKVVTTGGIYGVIAGVTENKFQLKIASNVKVEITKSAIAGKIPEGGN